MQGAGAESALGYERLVPSVLLPPEDPSGPRPRTVRDWLVDIGVVVVSAVLGVVTLVATVDTAPEPVSTTAVVVDVAAGVVAIAALLVRRRHPVAVGILTAALGAVSVLAGFAASVGLFTVAVHRRFVLIIPVIVVNVAAANVYWAVRPAAQSWLTANAISVAVIAIVVGFGMFVRARRQLVWTLQERARRAEDEQQVLADQARAGERARIAREMHDVLGHRISLMALHAGGLELRPDLPSADIAATAGLLRSTAREALDDLRTVIGILRDDGTLDAPSTPQPTLTDIERLVEDSRRAGATVSLTMAVDDSASAPPAVGRVAYRVVQEALTNVAKHASGAATIVDVSGGPDDGIVVGVRNSLTRRIPQPSLPSGGVGLIGLRERVELAGGTLSHRLNERGEFVVEARLRWA